jgi:DNA-binding transcriptional ArsR family regulator
MVKTIPKEANKNVDLQQGLGLVSTLAQDARAQQKHDRSVDQLKHDIEAIKAQSIKTTAAVTRIAIFDALKDHIKSTQDEHAHDLIAVAMLRAWLIEFIDWQDEDCIGDILDITLDPNINNEHDATCALQKRAVLRIEAASEADIYRYMALSFLIEERIVAGHKVLEPTPLYDGFATEQGIELDLIRKVADADVQEEIKAKIAAINKQIKAKKGETSAPKTTPTPPPAGAAIDDAAAGAKNKGKNASHAAQARKSKTSTEEAISGIATAMQSLGSEPLDASLGGSEAAAGRNGVAVGTKVEVQFGRHFGKTGTVTSVVGENMFDVLIGDGPKATTTRLSGQQFTKVRA